MYTQFRLAKICYRSVRLSRRTVLADTRLLQQVPHHTSTTSADFINHLKLVFAENGIPETLRLVATKNLQPFANSWTLTTWQVHHCILRVMALLTTVQTVKNLLGKAEASGKDPYMYLALLTHMYHYTPIDNNLPSPARLLSHRDYPTQLPISGWLQCSQALDSHREKLQNRQNIQRKQYDSRLTLELQKPISGWGGSRVPAKNQDLDSSTGMRRGQWAMVLHC